MPIHRSWISASFLIARYSLFLQTIYRQAMLDEPVDRHVYDGSSGLSEPTRHRVHLREQLEHDRQRDLPLPTLDYTPPNILAIRCGDDEFRWRAGGFLQSLDDRHITSEQCRAPIHPYANGVAIDDTFNPGEACLCRRRPC